MFINAFYSKNLVVMKKMHNFALAYQSGKHPMCSRPLEMEM